MNEETPDHSLEVYLPGLPNLGNRTKVERALYSAIHSARDNLSNQMADKDLFTDNVDGSDSWLRNIMPIIDNSDAFLFPPMSSLPKPEANATEKEKKRYLSDIAKRWFELTSTITGAHVGNSEQFGANGLSKPVAIMDPQGDGRWRDLLSVYDAFPPGVFKSNIHDIVHVIAPTGDYNTDYDRMNGTLINTLQTVIAGGKGKPLNSSKVGTGAANYKHYESVRKHPEYARHPFGVLFFGSATMENNEENKEYLDFSIDVAREVGKKGWRMITGVGTKGCMGAFDEGYTEGKAEFYKKNKYPYYHPAHIGVSTEAIMQFEGKPKYEGHDPIAGVDHLIIAEDIYDRMRFMIKGNDSKETDDRVSDTAKVIFVAPGGTGTMQEFAAMMQLATHVPLSKKNKQDANIMNGRTVVILNVNHYWDRLISVARGLGFDESYFLEATSKKQAMDIAEGCYEKWHSGLEGEQKQKYSNLPKQGEIPEPDWKGYTRKPHIRGGKVAGYGTSAEVQPTEDSPSFP